MRVPVSHRCCLFQVLDTYMFRSFLKARLNRRMDAFAQADLSTQSEEDGYLSPWWGARLGVQTRARRSSVRAERRPVGESHAASRALLRPWSACALFPPWCPPTPPFLPSPSLFPPLLLTPWTARPRRRRLLRAAGFSGGCEASDTGRRLGEHASLGRAVRSAPRP